MVEPTLSFLALLLACLAGMILLVFQMPGTWLILAATAIYAWHSQWTRIGVPVILVLAALAIAAELIELASSALLASRAGGSRRAAWAALAGGFVGMFLFSLPLPVIGTVAGGVIGCFLGALIAELTVRDDVDGALRVGTSAAIGRVLGLVSKLMIATAMTGLALGAALW